LVGQDLQEFPEAGADIATRAKSDEGLWQSAEGISPSEPEVPPAYTLSSTSHLSRCCRPARDSAGAPYRGYRAEGLLGCWLWTTESWIAIPLHVAEARQQIHPHRPNCMACVFRNVSGKGGDVTIRFTDSAGRGHDIARVTKMRPPQLRRVVG
jgi:hypothetical protein